MRRSLLLLAALLLSPSLATAEGGGTLHLSARPACDVFLNGEPVGSTEETRRGLPLPAGEYSVRFVCSGEACEEFERRTGTKTLTVKDGETSRYHADFHALNRRAPPATAGAKGVGTAPSAPESRSRSADISPPEGEPAGVAFLTATPGAWVTIDDEYAGTTAELVGGVRLAPGAHTVRFVCDGDGCEGLAYRTGQKTITVVQGEELRYDVDFVALNRR